MERLAAVEISYRTAATAIRERFAMDVAARGQHAAALCSTLGECVIIKTCGRVEVYVADAPNAAALVEVFAGSLGLPAADVASIAKTYEGGDVVLHLLRVASGLESPILGEDHILGQVRDAFLGASDSGTCGASLSALFRAAICAGRRVRRATGINRIAGSYAEQAVKFVRRSGVSHSSRVLVIGTGTLGFEVATALRAKGFEHLCIAGRHAARREEKARLVGAASIAWESLREGVALADVAIACTSSPMPVLTREMLPNDDRTRLLIDLGMPRNIEPSVAGTCGVTLATLDDVLTRGDASAEIVRQAECIIDIERRRVESWFRARMHIEAICRLRVWAADRRTDGSDARKRAAHLAIMRLRSRDKEAAA